jgi:hypothetical protein
MSNSAENPDEPRIPSYPPDEALRRAKALPPREERSLGDDMTDEEWDAFQRALAEL